MAAHRTQTKKCFTEKEGFIEPVYYFGLVCCTQFYKKNVQKMPLGAKWV